jgi:hypothetical protein
MKEKIRERAFTYIAMEIINYSLMIYEIFLVGLTVEQSLVCRIFTSFTDLIMLFFFFNTKFIWNEKAENNKLKNHLLAGVKMGIQFPVVYVIKISTANTLFIPLLQKLGMNIDVIHWSKIVISLFLAITVCFLGGFLYSRYRRKIIMFFNKIRIKIRILKKLKNILYPKIPKRVL